MYHYLLRKEPVDVSAFLADETTSALVQPVEIEERHHRGIELCLAFIEACVVTDFASDRNAGNGFFSSLLIEESHGQFLLCESSVVCNQVGGDRLDAKLSEKSHHLTAMIRGVVDQVLHLLPERLCILIAFEVVVGERRLELFLGEGVDELVEFLSEGSPFLPEPGKRGNIFFFDESSWTCSFPSLQPDPFRAVVMDERAANSAVAGVHVLDVLLFRKCSDDVENSVCCPLVEGEKSSDVVEIHCVLR